MDTTLPDAFVPAQGTSGAYSSSAALNGAVNNGMNSSPRIKVDGTFSGRRRSNNPTDSYPSRPESLLMRCGRPSEIRS